LPFSIAVPKLSQDHLFARITFRQLTRETSVAAAPTNAAINRWKVIWNCKKMQKGGEFLAAAKICSAVDHACSFLCVNSASITKLTSLSVGLLFFNVRHST